MHDPWKGAVEAHDGWTETAARGGVRIRSPRPFVAGYVPEKWRYGTSRTPGEMAHQRNRMLTTRLPVSPTSSVTVSLIWYRPFDEY